MFTAAALLALIGLTPGILALIGAPSLAGLAALSVADKITLATTVIGLLPHGKLELGKLGTMTGRKLPVIVPHEGYVTGEFVPGWRGPCAWGCAPEWRTEWHPQPKKTTMSERRQRSH